MQTNSYTEYGKFKEPVTVIESRRPVGQYEFPSNRVA